MAAVHAGTKRSHHRMRADYDGHNTLTIPPSREHSPKVRSPFRPTSAAPRSRPTTGPDSRPRRAVFEPSASIVLVGLRGSGRSSLGVIAAAAYNYRLIESERAFADATGLSPTEYRASRGIDDFQRRNREVLQRVLQTYTEKAIIICSFSDLENGGASLLQDYAQAHPVIHITRDAKGLYDYFKTWTLERVNQLLLASGSILRSCVNFEFFNLSEDPMAKASADAQPLSKRNWGIEGKHLTLKRVERDFLRLLRNVVGDSGRSIAHHSAYPLSQIAVDERAHTFAVRIEARDVLQGTIDLEAAQTGADCIELCVDAPATDKQKDFREIAHAFAVVRRNSILPIWSNASAKSQSDHDAVQSLYDTVSYCLGLGPELCTVDCQMSDAQLQVLAENKCSSKLVASAHYPQRPPEGWRDQTCVHAYGRATRLNYDLVKVTMPADSIDAAFEAKAYCSRMQDTGHPAPVIAYEEGPAGRTSKCFNGVLTSVQPPDCALVSRSEGGYRESITAKSITQALFASFAFEPLRFHIYGRDVSYSLSPAMHNSAYAACGMRHELTIFNCDDLEGLRGLVQATDFGGSAILQPFKTVVMPMLDSVSSHAKAIGAVNTVIPIRSLGPDGETPSDLEIIRQRNRQGPLLGLYGTNTDWIGIRSCVRRGLSPANTVRPTSTGLICGAGGMARAAVHSLASLGCQNIFICNRTPAHAHDIARHYNSLIDSDNLPELESANTNKTRVQVIESFADSWPAGVRHPTMIVCCIPADDADHVPIDITLPTDWLKSPTGGVVVEVAYKRPVTPLISQIRALADQGWILYDGFDVLPEQAYAQFEVFTGRRAPRKLMKDQVLKHYNAMISAPPEERD